MRDQILSVLLIGAVLLACKLPGTEKEGAPASSAAVQATPTPAAAPLAAPVAPAASAAAAATATAEAASSDYSRQGIREIPSNCSDARIVLLAIPKTHFEDETFHWRFARQVTLANRGKFRAVSALTGKKAGDLVFESADHAPTKGVALTVKCSDAETCSRFAAAYKTVVPTSHPEVSCGKLPTIGATVDGPPVIPLQAPEPEAAAMPAKTDVVGKCVRLAACQAARDFKLEGDPAIECQKKPSKFKLDCAMKTGCDGVLSCVEK